MTTQQETLEDEIERMIGEGHEYVEVVATDLNGALFGKRYPASHLRNFAKNGLSLPRANFALSITGESIDDYTGLGMDDGDPDLALGLVPGGLSVIHWGSKPRLQALMTSTADYDWPDPRRVLARVVDRFKALDLNPVVALELEFTLFDGKRAANGQLNDPANPKTGELAKDPMFCLETMDGFEPFLDDVLKNCKSQGIETTAVCSELGVGQFEINFTHYDDPLLAADKAQLYKRTVKAVAREHGFIATFMAKPDLDKPSNGQHIHASVVDNDGNNIFSGGDKPTQALMHAIGGLQASAKEAMIYLAPSINSYRRFALASCVPTGPTWAFDHRHVAFRIPQAAGNAWRVENRLAGADANCYLSMASMLASMLVGLEQKMEPSEETKGVPEMDYSSLPLTMRDAIDAARDGSLIKPILGEDFVKLYANHREGELASFEDYISARELDWYL